MGLPVAPLLQVTVPTQPLAVRFTFVPAVTSVALAVRLSTGGGSTVTVAVVVPTQPLTVHDTLYCVVVCGATVIDWVVALFDQRTVPAQFCTVSTADEPAQMVVLATVGAGKGFTVTETVTVDRQLGALVTVTVNVLTPTGNAEAVAVAVVPPVSATPAGAAQEYV